MVDVFLVSLACGVIGGYLNRDKGGSMNGLSTSIGFFMGGFFGTCACSVWNLTWGYLGVYPSITLSII